MSCEMNSQAFLGEDSETLFQVGRRFLRGDGVEQDLDRARQLLSRAAANGHPIAARLMEELKVQEPSTETSVVCENASETTALFLMEDIKRLETEISSKLDLVREKQQELEALLKK